MLLISVALVLASLVGASNIQAASGVTQRSVGWYLLDATFGLANQNLPTPDPLTATDEIGFERQLYASINQTRASYGLPPLALVSALKKSARAHSKDMFNTQ